MDVAFILKAADFAANKHRHQKRKGVDFSPYINHPIRVAALLAEVGGVDDPEILAAALLHDTLENTETSAQELEKVFGSRVKTIVVELTNDKSLPRDERKRQEIEHAKKLSNEAALIRLCDKTSNVYDTTNDPPADWDNERRRHYLIWSEQVVNNLSHVDAALLNYFQATLKEGQRILGG